MILAVNRLLLLNGNRELKSYELRVTNYELRVTSYELLYAMYDVKCTNYDVLKLI